MDLIVEDALALLVWFNRTNRTNQINETDQMDKSQCAMCGTWC